MTTFGIFTGIALFGVAFVSMSVLYVFATAHLKQLEIAAKGEDEWA